MFAALLLLIFAAPAVIAQTSSPLTQKAANADELLAMAQQNGHVRVIVTFDAPLSSAQARPNAATIAAHKARVAALQDAIIATHFASASNPTPGQGFNRGLKRFQMTPGFVANVSATELQALAADPRVRTLEYNRAFRPFLIDSVPLIGMAAAYPLGATGDGRAVAVIDTGVKSTHEFLAGKVVSEACFSNSGGSAGGVSLCPNGQSMQTGAGAANADTAQCISGSTQLCDHGTHVAGIAAGLNTNFQNGEPPNGVGKFAKLLAVQTFTRFNDTTNCTAFGAPAPCIVAFIDDLIDGLDHVLAHLDLPNGVKVASANMSVGGAPQPGTCDKIIPAFKIAIDNLRNAGVLSAIAAGNDGSTSLISVPACISSAVAVGSTTKQDVISSFSNMSDAVDVLAPGSTIQSSIPVVGPGTSTYAFFSGTSMATPHVAGAIAAVRTACTSATADQIESALKSTGTPVTDNMRPGGTVTKPRIRVDLAVQSLACGSVLAVSPSTPIAASGDQGGPFSPPSFQYQLSASSGTLSYAISGIPSWLTASSTSGSVTTSPTAITFTVNASASALAVGAYNATISFINATNGNGNATRSATLTVNAVPPSALQVLPGTSISSSGTQGGPFSPPSFQYQLSASSGALNYSITGVPSWLTASATSGAVTTSPANVTFSVNASANALAPGAYSTTITFTNTTNGVGNTTRTATLTVNPAVVAPPNDDFANATAISGLSGSKSGTNVGSTLETGEPPPFAGSGNHTVWWKWVAPASGQITFDTVGSDFNTVLTAYAGSAIDALTLIQGNDDIDPSVGNLRSRISFNAQSGFTYYIRVDGLSPSDTGNVVLNWSEPLTASNLFAAVLPYARSVQIGHQAAAFGSIINTGTTTATACAVSLPAGLAGTFIYQTTDANNLLIGSSNTPADIPSNSTQRYVFAYTPSTTLNSMEIGVVFKCSNAPPVVSILGVNTFILSAAPAPTPDIVAIAVTPSADGIANIPGATGTGFFAAAGVNIGTTATITASADDGGRNLPVALTICQTDSTGNCLSPPAATTTTTFNANATVTYTVFVQGSANIPFDPANNRLFLRFKDAGAVTRGASNVAVRTSSGPKTATANAK